MIESGKRTFFFTVATYEVCPAKHTGWYILAEYLPISYVQRIRTLNLVGLPPIVILG